MSIPITCAGCKSAFDVPDTLAGKTIRCTSCKAQMAVPESLDAVEVEAVEVEAVEEAAAGPGGKKPFGFGSGPAPAAAKSDDTPAPKKASPPKPAPAPAAKAAKKGPAVELDDDEDDEDDKPKAKPGKGAPAAKKPGITGSTKKRRDDDDDDDDDDKPRKKKQQAAGGSGMLIAIIAAGTLALAAVAGGGIWFFTKEKKPDEVAKTDDATKPAEPPVIKDPAAPGVTPVKPPPGKTENALAKFIPFDRIGTPGAWAAHKGDGFTAEFLGQPEDKTETAGGLEMKFTGVGARDGAVTLVAYGQLPPEIVQTSNDPKLQLNLMMLALSQKEPFKGVVPLDVTMDGHPGKELDLKLASAEAKARVVVAKGRAYVFLAGGVYKDDKPSLPRADIDRFFASLKVTYTGDVVAVGPGPGPGPGPGGKANPIADFFAGKPVGTVGEWKTNESSDGYSVELPGIPAPFVETDEKDGTVAKMLAIAASGQYLIVAGCFHPGPTILEKTGNDPNKLLAYAMERLKGQGLPLENIQSIVLGQHVGNSFGIKAGPFNGSGTVAATKNRIFVVMWIAKDAAGQTAGKRAADSIKITYTGDVVAVGPGPGPGPGDPPNPATPATPADGNLKIKLDPFFTAAFDADKKDVFVIDARPTDPRLKGALLRYEYPSFKLLGRYKLTQAAARCVIDPKSGLLYVATVTNLQTAQLNPLDRSTASGDVAIYDLKPIRDGKTADGKALGDGAELKPVATLVIKQTINALELSADGKTLYVLTTGAVGGTTTRKSALAIIDTETRKESPRKPLSELSWDMTKTGDGKNLLILETPGKNKSASAVKFDTTAMAVIDPTAFPGVLWDVAPLAAGGAFVSVVPLQGAIPGGLGAPPGGAGGPPGGAGPGAAGGAPNFKLYLLDAKGSTEQDLGPGARSANNGYIKLDPENKKLFVSSYRAPGLDVYDVTDTSAPNGLKLKASIKSAGGQLVGGHFHVSPDGKALLFHNGVVIDTDKVGGAVPGAGGPPVGPGGAVPPPPPPPGVPPAGPGPGPGGPGADPVKPPMPNPGKPPAPGAALAITKITTSQTDVPLGEAVAFLAKTTGVTITIATEKFAAKGVQNVADTKVKIEAKDTPAALVLGNVAGQVNGRFEFTKEGGVVIVPN